MEVYFKYGLCTWGMGDPIFHLQGWINRLISTKNSIKHNKDAAVILINALMVHAVMDGMQARCIQYTGGPIPP